MKEFYNCPGCGRVIKCWANPCPNCQCSLFWSQQGPTCQQPSEEQLAYTQQPPPISVTQSPVNTRVKSSTNLFPGEKDKKYGWLRTISAFIRVIGGVIFVFGNLGTIASCSCSALPKGWASLEIFILFVTINWTALTLIAFGGCIEVLVDIEENTRKKKSPE